MKTTRNIISVVMGVTISVFMLIGIGLASDLRIHAQNETETTEGGRSKHH
jgi:hypothetical protein